MVNLVAQAIVGAPLLRIQPGGRTTTRRQDHVLRRGPNWLGSRYRHAN
jgi:hypothetical protein